MNRLEKIQKYAYLASPAVYGARGEKPKDGIDDLSVITPEVLLNLNQEFVLVGLNVSENFTPKAWSMFHAGGKFWDFRIRDMVDALGLKNVWITDLIKNFPMKAANDVTKHFKKHSEEIKPHLRAFEQELDDIGVQRPTLVALGRNVEVLLKKHLGHKYRVLYVPHWANQSGINGAAMAQALLEQL